MNIYQKLATARVELQNMKIKKTGKNTYSGFSYYELSDFLVHINALNAQKGIVTRFNIIADCGKEKAVLTLINVDEPQEKIDFTAPTAEVEIGKKKDGTGGAEPIQNLGGKITYMRRYMLFTAYEMVESDSVDSVNRELTNEVAEEDLQAINAAKSVDELTKLYNQLQKTYKIKLITPIFKEARTKLEQDSDIKIIKKESK